MSSGYTVSDNPVRTMKKQRTNGGEGLATMQSAESFEHIHKVSPSPVIHIRGLIDYVNETEIRSSLAGFGTIQYVMNFPQKQMALVEFENIDSAREVVNYASTKNLQINGKPAMFNFSTSQSIKRPNPVDEVPNCVLLLTILNIQHPITVEVLYAACSPIGTVYRICIFRKNGVQAMVEFDSVETAAKAKQALNGADIYLNCCTIKAEYGKPRTLTVRRNEGDTWDFTVSTPLPGQTHVRNQPLLADPRMSYAPMAYDMFGGPSAGGQGDMAGGYGSGGPQRGRGGDSGGRWPAAPPAGADDPMGMNAAMMGGAYDMMGSRGGMVPAAMYGLMMGGGMGGGKPLEQPECVLMLYGLVPDSINCTKLFNLICLYGNVIRIKFLKSKEGAAMIQMGDRESCDRVTRHLNDAKMHGSKLIFSYSKQQYIQEVPNPYQLLDLTPSYKDFSQDKSNRYLTPEAAAKNRVTSPTSVLYFYNGAPDATEDVLRQLLLNCGAADPFKITILPARSEKSSRGYIHFNDPETAIDAILLANNTKMTQVGNTRPFILRFSFSFAPKSHD